LSTLFSFYKNTRLIFAQNLEQIKNNPASAKEQSLKFSIKVVNNQHHVPHNYQSGILLPCLFTQWRSRGGGMWGYAFWVAGLGGTPAYLLQSFKNAF